MYWLLTDERQEIVRHDIKTLTKNLSVITGNPQIDQLFPYVGRKDRRKARVVVDTLTVEENLIIDPFSGSGSLVYAAANARRRFSGNEWEPYAQRISNAPWRLPIKDILNQDLNRLQSEVEPYFNYLYKTTCPCGHDHVLDSFFFDRQPYRIYSDNIAQHERLGQNGENITYRVQYKCPECGRTEKHFDEDDEAHLNLLEMEQTDEIFDNHLIVNSRINLTEEFSKYGSLFPQRSKIGLSKLWKSIQEVVQNDISRFFLEDAFLSIIPQAKFKDYRSKSQDLHCPNEKLREVNIYYRFLKQVEKRYKGLSNYDFSIYCKDLSNFREHISCKDFRSYLDGFNDESVDLIFTDPPWTDGNPFFEKAQLYHPWLDFSLIEDKERLEKEFVVTDAPSRKDFHNEKKWWDDTDEFFAKSFKVLYPHKYLILFFRPIPAKNWLTNLNKLKYKARKNGFEPLLSIDVDSSDPSMRIQQSSSYVFSKDVMMVFLKLNDNERRFFFNGHDIDELAFRIAEETQEKIKGPFQYQAWRNNLSEEFRNKDLYKLDLAEYEERIWNLFCRYTDEVSNKEYLPKANTPFSGQLFDTPAIERLYTYIPFVIKDLTKEKETFSYDEFLLTLATFVENGTKMLIGQIEKLDIKKLIEIYADPIEGNRFLVKPAPELPEGIENILELDPYEFENFTANLFLKMGYTSVSVAGRTGDKGVDIIAENPDGKSAIIQCKRYIGNNVSATPIQRLHSFAISRGVDERIIVTTSDYTSQAIEEAKITGTRMINGQELEKLIAEFLPDYFN